MNIKLMVFKGASIYCQSAAAVIEIQATFEISRFLPRLKCLLDLNPKILENSRTQFIFPSEGSSRIDEMRLFAESWASLCAAADCDVFMLGGSRIRGKNYLYVSSADNDVAKWCVNYLLRSLQSEYADSQLSDRGVNNFIATIKPHVLGARSRDLIDAARYWGIPTLKLFGPNMFVFGVGKNSIIFNRMAPGDDSHHGTLISRDKQRSKQLFVKLGMPVAHSLLIRSPDELDKNLEKVFFPCVAKPIDGSQGTGVYVNLKNKTDLVRALNKSFQTTNLSVMVEEQINGEDIRLLICRGELLIAVKRAKPFVVGDGISTITQLVEIVNTRRDSEDNPERHLPKISMNDEAVDYLLTQGVDLEYIPAAGEKIEVRGTPHGTHGGDMFDVTDEVHPEIISLASLASERIGGALCGLDYISPDHTKSTQITGGVFLEINTFPGFKPLDLLSPADRLESIRKILGKAASPIQVTIIVSQLPIDLTDVKASIIGMHTAWYCSGSVGFGPPHNQWGSSNIPVPVAFERLVLDSRADRLVFFLTVDEFVRYGLPSDRVTSVTVVDSEMISSEVCDALKLSAGLYNKVTFSSLYET